MSNATQAVQSSEAKPEQSKIKHILTSFIILVIAVVIIVGIAIGFGAIGIPLWPFIFLLFFYSSFDKFDSSKFAMTCIGTAIGIFVGMSRGIFTDVLGSSIAGIVVFAILAIVLATGFIMGDVPWASIYGVLTMTVLTLFTLDPCIWAGVPAAVDMGWVEAFLRCMASFAVGVCLFAVVNVVMKKKAAQAIGEQK